MHNVCILTIGGPVLSGIKEHSRANTHLKAGLERLGVHCGEIPRNTGHGHACGHCSFGCASGEKRDTTATFLADAVRSGAKILTGARSCACSLPLWVDLAFRTQTNAAMLTVGNSLPSLRALSCAALQCHVSLQWVLALLTVKSAKK